MTDMPIEDRVRHFFLAMGAQPTGQDAPDILGFTLGSERIRVVLLKNDALLDRGKLVDGIIRASSLKHQVELVYVATSRLIGTSIPANLFSSNGMGLLLFDDRRIQEVVTPQASRPAPTPNSLPVADGFLAKELTDLRAMCADLERTVGLLRREMDQLRSASLNHGSTEDTTTHVKEQPTNAEFYQNTVALNNLPSFFVGNPWLEVLSRRGVAEGDEIAA